jgi:hypothetical protein
LILLEEAKYRQTAWMGILLALAFAYLSFRDWKKMKAESMRTTAERASGEFSGEGQAITNDR